MKKFMTALFLLTATQANAAQILDGRINASEGTIELELRFGGGCGDHDFRLEVHPTCAESYPLQCSATLVHSTDDICEGILFRVVSFKLADYGLTESYYSNAYLTIKGANNSSVNLQLP